MVSLNDVFVPSDMLQNLGHLPHFLIGYGFFQLEQCLLDIFA